MLGFLGKLGTRRNWVVQFWVLFKELIQEFEDCQVPSLFERILFDGALLCKKSELYVS
jgi:hypothetical protein